MDFIIATGGDANYYDLIDELLQSIRRCPEGRLAPVGVIDAGLTQDQVAELRRRGAIVVRPDWEYEVARRRARGRDFLKANIGKAFLDRYFPQAEILIWLDADTWLQNWDCIPLFLAAARKQKLGIVSQASRFQTYYLTLKWHWFGLAEPRSILYKNARRAGVDKAVARDLAARPVLNAGAFSLRRDAPHWQVWRRHQGEVLKHGRIFTSDQLALALTIYADGLPVEALPEWCNYIGPYRFDSEAGCFVEYYLPHRPISVMHLVGQDAMRRDAAVTASIRDQHDRPIDVSLRYSAWHTGAAPAGEPGLAPHPA